MKKKPQRRGRRVASKEIRELLARPDCVPVPDLTRPGTEVYRLPDNHLLVVFRDSRTWGNLVEGGEKVLAELRAMREWHPQHVLEGVLPGGAHFPAEVPALVDELARAAAIPREKLDGSEASLVQIDRAVRRLGAKAHEPAVMAALIAYVGEVMRLKSGGAWEMRQAGEVWEPWILGPDGRRYNPFMVVYRELDAGRGGSIAGAANGEMGPRFEVVPDRDHTN